MRLNSALTLALSTLLATACTGPLVGTVADATYLATVPTDPQYATEAAGHIPGGFRALRNSGVDEIAVTINESDVTFALDGREVTSRIVSERLTVTDREGSGPFKGAKEILVLGVEPLVIGGLTIAEPVIWPGSFEGSPVITIKPRNDQERGPDVSCSSSEMCLLLTSGVDPKGEYEDANDPSLEQNPIATIRVTSTSIEFTLDSGQVVDASRDSEATTDACGLSETRMWDVPAAVGLDIQDPVLVHAACPSTPGDVHLVIMGRGDVPALAPLGPEAGGEWCPPSSNCLMFVPRKSG